MSSFVFIFIVVLWHIHTEHIIERQKNKIWTKTALMLIIPEIQGFQSEILCLCSRCLFRPHHDPPSTHPSTWMLKLHASSKQKVSWPTASNSLEWRLFKQWGLSEVDNEGSQSANIILTSFLKHSFILFIKFEDRK